MCFVFKKDNNLIFLQRAIPNHDFTEPQTLLSSFLNTLLLDYFQEFKLRIEHTNQTALSLSVGK